MPPNPLDQIRRLAAQVRRVNPNELSPGQISEWRNYSRMLFTPKAQAAMKKSQELADAAQKAESEELRLALQKASDNALYESKRWAMMDQSASTISRAKRNYDEDVRALWIPGADNMPAGISTFQLPGHYRDDPLAYDATHLENLGASGAVPGVGRVLLRQTGLESPSNPMIWESINQKPTLDFYKARGAQVLHDATGDSQFSADNTELPVFWVNRGDMIKEAKGGLVKYKECHCGK